MTGAFQPERKNSALLDLVKSLNGNTILLTAGFAIMYYLCGVFLTKETYYRDQIRLESALNDIKERQNKILETLIISNSKR